MTKKENLQRHLEDSRVVIINSIEDFNLWENRKEYGFKGLLLPKAFSKEECDFISKDIAKVVKKYFNYDIEFTKDSYSTEFAKKSKLSPLTVEKITQCKNLFENIAGQDRMGVYVRKNATDPDYAHTHGSVLSAIFSGEGTQFIKTSYKFTPDEIADRSTRRMPSPKDMYQIDVGALIMFEDIWHTAGKLADKPKENPRTQIVLA